MVVEGEMQEWELVELANKQQAEIEAVIEQRDGYEKDYDHVADAVYEHLGGFVLDDDHTAEPVLIALAVQEAGEWITDVRQQVADLMEKLGHCPICQENPHWELCHFKPNPNGDSSNTEVSDAHS